jgi:nucleosome binding factor SPN SPT16 subunit
LSFLLDFVQPVDNIFGFIAKVLVQVLLLFLDLFTECTEHKPKSTERIKVAAQVDKKESKSESGRERARARKTDRQAESERRTERQTQRERQERETLEAALF